MISSLFWLTFGANGPSVVCQPSFIDHLPRSGGDIYGEIRANSGGFSK
jgi:hypothetical protein